MIPFNFIPEKSEATPGLWNRMFSAVSSSIASIEGGSLTTINVSAISATGMVRINANSGTTNYILFNDTSGARSDYIIGSQVGGTQDGLNIWDESGQTMIASFSKQSIRFFQNVVGAVFDTGGALSDTLNAATFGTGADSKESRIQAAISAATAAGIHRVYLPASMVSYNARVVSFASTVQMIWEGGNQDVCDIIAYGAHPSVATSSTSAIQAAINSAHSQGRVCFIPAGAFGVENLYFYPSSVLRGAASGSGGVPVAQLYQGSANTAILQPFNPAVRTDSFVMEDFLVSSFGNIANRGLIDCVNCLGFRLKGISFSGASIFQVRVVGGPSAGNAGFGLIEACAFNSGQTDCTDIMLQASTNDQPDGMVASNNFHVTSKRVTWYQSFATVGTGPDTWVITGNRCESATSFNSILSGHMSNAKVIGNRFETTASSASLGVTLRPASVGNTQQCAVFLANSYAAASRISFIDTGFAQSTRWGDSETGSVLRHDLPDGTAANPAWSFRSETSVGFYRSGASTMALAGATALVPFTDIPGNGSIQGRVLTRGALRFGVSLNLNPAGGVDSAGQSAWAMNLNAFGSFSGSADQITYTHTNPGGGNVEVASLDSAGQWGVGAGSAVGPSLTFTSEKSLGFYRSTASTIRTSYGTFWTGGQLWTSSGISVGTGGTLIPAISSTSSLVAPFVVQGSASSFTIITWAAAQAGDHIMVTPGPTTTVSSLSSGLVAHSHCTQNGQVEFRLSNVSTLAQNQSQRTWYFTRISAF